MILAVDVTYTEAGARVAGLLFETWDAVKPSQQIVVEVQDIAEYEPGQFYKRELPCIAKLLDEITRLEVVLDCIVIDGYVWLGSPERGGLGAHLYDYLQGSLPIIGVAKSEFVGTPDETRLLRGDSIKPLFVTTAGIVLDAAKAHIAAMHGKFRMPDLLKLVDGLSRGHV